MLRSRFDRATYLPKLEPKWQELLSSCFADLSAKESSFEGFSSPFRAFRRRRARGSSFSAPRSMPLKGARRHV